jgi:hypothetical protein
MHHHDPPEALVHHRQRHRHEVLRHLRVRQTAWERGGQCYRSPISAITRTLLFLAIFVERISTVERCEDFLKTGNDNKGCFIEQIKYFLSKRNDMGYQCIGTHHVAKWQALCSLTGRPTLPLWRKKFTLFI